MDLSIIITLVVAILVAFISAAATLISAFVCSIATLSAAAVSQLLSRNKEKTNQKTGEDKNHFVMRSYSSVNNTYKSFAVESGETNHEYLSLKLEESDKPTEYLLAQFNEPERPYQLFFTKMSAQVVREIDADEKLGEFWREFIAETNDNKLEFHLYRIEHYINEHPKEAEAFLLKANIARAIEKVLEVKAKRRLIGPPPRHPVLWTLAAKILRWLSSFYGRMLSILKNLPYTNFSEHKQFSLA